MQATILLMGEVETRITTFDTQTFDSYRTNHITGDITLVEARPTPEAENDTPRITGAVAVYYDGQLHISHIHSDLPNYITIWSEP